MTRAPAVSEMAEVTKKAPVQQVDRDHKQLVTIQRSVRLVGVTMLLCIFAYHFVTQYEEFKQRITLQTEQYTDKFEYPDTTLCIKYGDFNFVASGAIGSLIAKFFLFDTVEKTIKQYHYLTELFNISITASKMDSESMGLTFMLDPLTFIVNYVMDVLEFTMPQIPTITNYLAHDFILDCKFEGVKCDFRDFKPAKTSVHMTKCFTFPSEEVLKRRQKNDSYEALRNKSNGLEVVFRTPNVERMKSNIIKQRMPKIFKAMNMPTAKLYEKLGLAARTYDSPMMIHHPVAFYYHPPNTYHRPWDGIYHFINYKASLTASYTVTHTESLPDVSDSFGESCAEKVPNYEPFEFLDGSFKTFKYNQDLCRTYRPYEDILKKCHCKDVSYNPIFEQWNSRTSLTDDICFNISVKFWNPELTIQYSKENNTLIFRDLQSQLIGTLKRDSLYKQKFVCLFKVITKKLRNKDCPKPCSVRTYKIKTDRTNLNFSPLEAKELIQSINGSIATATKLGLPVSELTRYAEKLDENLLVAGKMIDEIIRGQFVPSKYIVHTIRQVYAYPLVSLLSDVGGILGLWLGVSALTFADMVGVGIKWLLSFRCTEKKVADNELETASSNYETMEKKTEVSKISDDL